MGFQKSGWTYFKGIQKSGLCQFYHSQRGKSKAVFALLMESLTIRAERIESKLPIPTRWWRLRTKSNEVKCPSDSENLCESDNKDDRWRLHNLYHNLFLCSSIKLVSSGPLLLHGMYEFFFLQAAVIQNLYLYNF